MDLDNKKISPQAVLALKEALPIIFWKKDELKDFVKLTLKNSTIVGTINWDGTKRESVKELIERMTNRPDIYKEDLINLILGVTDFTDFPHLEFWDDDGSKRKKAKEAVQKLRAHTKGYHQITQEQEEAKIRRMESEKKIIKNKSLDDELNALKEKFTQLTKKKDLQQRGYDLEKLLNELFLLYELDPRGSFKIYGEQIDGAFTFDGTDFLLEAKWKRQVDRSDLASFCYKVETKLKMAVGLLVTMEGITKEAIAPEFKSIIIMDGLDLISILEGRVSLPDLLYKKRRRASETGKIYVSYYDL
ncbi:MAG: hypothetical protein A2W85_06895 [Bacteroidetes bacterium GWF2_41_31]|nr:MAG: hypothetical protein A2W85_06895 [Bacteroidetes bacterium GWF2_41_31]